MSEIEGEGTLDLLAQIQGLTIALKKAKADSKRLDKLLRTLGATRRDVDKLIACTEGKEEWTAWSKRLLKEPNHE